MTTLLAETIFPAAILGIAAVVVHATFQAAVSVMTLMSSHSLGKQRSITRLLALNTSYTLGAITSHSLLLGTAVYLVSAIYIIDDRSWWLLVAMLNVIFGALAGLYYYRRQKGTVLWMPRKIAEYLSKRAKSTSNTIEAFLLGYMSALAELPFIIAPLSIVAVLLRGTPSIEKAASVLSYAIIVSLPLLAITALVGSGHKISTTQRWRESNKSFLQYTASFGSLLIALFIIAYYTIGAGR